MRDSLALILDKSFSVKEKFYFARTSSLEMVRVLTMFLIEITF